MTDMDVSGIVQTGIAGATAIGVTSLALRQMNGMGRKRRRRAVKRRRR